MTTRTKMIGVLFAALSLAAVLGLAAKTDQATHPLVGTWEKVAFRYQGAKDFTNQPASQRVLKMYTPTNYAVIDVDPAAGGITRAHGGACVLGNGMVTERAEYRTGEGYKPGSMKSVTIEVRFDGDKFIQSFGSGDKASEEIWRRAKPVDLAGAAGTAEKEMTLKGEAICAKCALKQTSECELALQVESGGIKMTYFLRPEQLRKQLEKQAEKRGVNWCATPISMVATGVVKQVDGRPVIVASKLEEAVKKGE